MGWGGVGWGGVGKCSRWQILFLSEAMERSSAQPGAAQALLPSSPTLACMAELNTSCHRLSPFPTGCHGPPLFSTNRNNPTVRCACLYCRVEHLRHRLLLLRGVEIDLGFLHHVLRVLLALPAGSTARRHSQTVWWCGELCLWGAGPETVLPPSNPLSQASQTLLPAAEAEHNGRLKLPLLNETHKLLQVVAQAAAVLVAAAAAPAATPAAAARLSPVCTGECTPHRNVRLDR